MRLAAIYMRKCSYQQRGERTVENQTEALLELAARNELEVPKEWIFEDKGYSGMTLERPGLRRVRDLVAEGQISAVLIYAHHQLSRKQAHLSLLIEEFARKGVETRLIQASAE